MYPLRHNWMVLVLSALVLTAPVALCQQQSQDQGAAPIPAYRSPLASAADNGDSETNSQELKPDTRPLAGAQYLTLGGLPTTRSYWQPHFDLFVTGDSNPLQQTTSNWSTWTSFYGGMDIHRNAGKSETTIGYTGGAMYSNNGTAPNGIVQVLNFADKFSFRRSSLSFFDQLSYLPEQAFGYGGPGVPPLYGAGGLGPGLVPAQAILTGRGQGLANAFVTEVDTVLTPRSSLTITGGYLLLHYFDSSSLDNKNVVARIGYNYRITEKNTIASLYTYSAYRYQQASQFIDNHIAQVSYGRRVTGRLAFQIAGGPAIYRTSASTTGGGEGGGTTGASVTRLYGALNTSVQYQLPRTLLGLTYLHGLNGGSGVLVGSLNDMVTGSATRQVSRTFSSGVTGGYSRSTQLPTGTTAAGQSYNYWFAGASLSHPWGQSLGLTLSYQFQYQDANKPFCIGATCGTSVVRHLISVGLGWHERPLLF